MMDWKDRFKLCLTIDLPHLNLQSSLGNSPGVKQRTGQRSRDLEEFQMSEGCALLNILPLLALELKSKTSFVTAYDCSSLVLGNLPSASCKHHGRFGLRSTTCSVIFDVGLCASRALKQP